MEITQPGLRQVQVNPKAGYTFQVALRSFLRADPDIIMIYHSQVVTNGKSYTMPFYTGLKPNSLVIINTDVDVLEGS